MMEVTNITTALNVTVDFHFILFFFFFFLSHCFNFLMELHFYFTSENWVVIYRMWVGEKKHFST